MQKRIEITTSKATFLLVDLPTDDKGFVEQHLIDAYGSVYFKLSEISEEEAKMLVDENNEYGITLFQNYQTTSMAYFDEQLSAIESLHSLIKSKGMHLYENPYSNTIGLVEFDYHRNRAESKTFYNPILFIKSK